MENNNAPFYVGQRVVCVKPIIGYVKGSYYTIQDCRQCVACGNWHVMILEDPYPGTMDFKCKCGGMVKKSTAYYGCLHYRFAPIQEAYSDITAELASKVEVGDTADQPVRVLSN